MQPPSTCTCSNVGRTSCEHHSVGIWPIGLTFLSYDERRNSSIPVQISRKKRLFVMTKLIESSTDISGCDNNMFAKARSLLLVVHVECFVHLELQDRSFPCRSNFMVTFEISRIHTVYSTARVGHARLMKLIYHEVSLRGMRQHELGEYRVVNRARRVSRRLDEIL